MDAFRIVGQKRLLLRAQLVTKFQTTSSGNAVCPISPVVYFVSCRQLHSAVFTFPVWPMGPTCLRALNCPLVRQWARLIPGLEVRFKTPQRWLFRVMTSIYSILGRLLRVWCWGEPRRHLARCASRHDWIPIHSCGLRYPRISCYTTNPFRISTFTAWCGVSFWI